MELTTIKQKFGKVLNKLKTMGVPFAVEENMLDLNADVLSSNETRFNVVESNSKKSGAFKIKFSSLPDPEKYAGTADYAKVKDIVAKAEALSQLDFTSGIIEVKGGYIGICGDSWSVEDFKKAQADKNDATILRNKAFFEYASGKTPLQIRKEYPALIADDRFRKLFQATEGVRISERNLKEQAEEKLSYQTTLTRTRNEHVDFENFMTNWQESYTTSLKNKLDFDKTGRQLRSDDAVNQAEKDAAKSVLGTSVEAEENRSQDKITEEAKKQAIAREKLYGEFDKAIREIERDEARQLRVIESVKNYINDFIAANPDKVDEMISAPGAFKNDIRVYIAAQIKANAKNKRVGKLIDQHNDVADKILEIFNSEPEAEPGK